MTIAFATKPAAALRAITMLAATGLVLVGIPWALIHFVGNPLPTVIPSWDDIRFAITNGQIQPETFMKGVALVTWATWAHLTASLIVEIAARARGGTATAVRGLGATQWIAAKIVSQCSLVVALLVHSSAGVVGAMAVPPMPTLAASVIVDAAPDATGSGAFEENAAETVVDETSGASIEVGRRDTLWGLAETHLGDGKRWQEIRDANVGRIVGDETVLVADFTSIEAGWTLIIPGLTEPDSNNTELASDPSIEAATVLETGYDSATGEWIIGSWTVEPGDHFWKISEEVLEAAWDRPATDAETEPYWAAVVEANRQHLISPGADANLIYPDQSFEVLLPPIPTDITSAGDATATTTPFPLDDLDQFAPTTQRSAPPEPATPPIAEASPLEPRVLEPEPATPATTASAAIDLPTTPPTAVEPNLAAGADEASEDNSTIDATTIGLGLFGTAIGAGALMTVLRRRRQHQAARRRPNTVIEDTPLMPSEFEHRIRPIGDTDAVRWLHATNRFLSHRLSLHPENPMPAVVAMRAGTFGVEVLLDEPCIPVDGFINGGAEGKAWRLHPDLDERMLEAEAAHAQPYSPALLPVGPTEAGDLLLDFEQLGSLSLTGHEDTITGWLRSIAVGVTSVPWSQHCEVIAIGLGDDIGNINQVTVPDDPIEWARQAVTIHTATAKRLSASPYENRVKPGEIHHPQIVLVGPGYPGIAQHLGDTADLAYSALALIAAAPLTNESRIDMQPNLAVVEPLGISFEPATTELDAIKLVVEVLRASEHTISTPAPDYFDTLTSESAMSARASLLDSGQILESMDGSNAEVTEPVRVDDEAIGAGGSGSDSAALSALHELGSADENGHEASRTVEDNEPSANPREDSDPSSDRTDDHEVGYAETATVASSTDEPMDAAPSVDESNNGHASEVVQAVEAPAAIEPLVAGSEVTARVALGAGCEPATEEAVASIMKTRPIEVRVLGAVPAVTGLAEEPRAKIEAVVVYVAFHRSMPSDRIRKVFWPTSVSRGTSDNAIAETRRLLGHNSEGESRLPLATNTGRFELDDEVGCDWHRFQQLVALSKAGAAPADEIACLEAALKLVEGQPGAEAPTKLYRWFTDDHSVYTHVETVLVDSAYRLGELAVDAGDPSLACWAAAQGLQAVPGQEALHRVQMKAAALAGDEQGIEDAYRAAMRSAEALSAWEDVQPETDELYAMITRRDRTARGTAINWMPPV